MNTSGADKALRLFFAIWPDEAAREAIAALARDVAAACRGKTPPPANIHLTLAFVGPVALDRVDALTSVGAAAARGVGPFRLEVDRVGIFRDAGIAWLGPGTMPASLAEVARQLRTGLAAQGFPVERRPFAAHVTLARNCRARLPRVQKAEPIAWVVDSLTLVASQLGAGGSRYRTQAEWPLGRRG